MKNNKISLRSFNNKVNVNATFSVLDAIKRQDF